MNSKGGLACARVGSRMDNDWDQSYQTGQTPWDSAVPEPMLVEALQSGLLPTGRLLEIGCGTGTNARFLAESGYQVLAVDLSPTALRMARERNDVPGVTYALLDVFQDPWPEGPFDAVVDRGCFHLFSEPEKQREFVENVARVLRPGGCWLSLIGSTEGPPRDFGPPRRSATNIVAVVEPFLEIVLLRAGAFENVQSGPAAFQALFRRREQPAQPPTE